MALQSIHAPFERTHLIWQENREQGDAALDELCECIHVCEKFEAPIMVAHAFIGFTEHTPTERGLERFAKLVALAEKTEIKIAFENTEGEEYLSALMNIFRSSPAVGFCWDSGHELCYNHSQDLLSLYGDRLLCTHLNDNLGIKSFNGDITWTDDLHLLLFDGIADWDNIAARLKRCGFKGPLTFELNLFSKPERHENDRYSGMDFEAYITECYMRACRVAAKMY